MVSFKRTEGIASEEARIETRLCQRACGNGRLLRMPSLIRSWAKSGNTWHLLKRSDLKVKLSFKRALNLCLILLK